MRKFEEIERLDSCWNKATLIEFIFVLLARDPAAPFAIRSWVEWRIAMGLNKREDQKIKDALEVAGIMEIER